MLFCAAKLNGFAQAGLIMMAAWIFKAEKVQSCRPSSPRLPGAPDETFADHDDFAVALRTVMKQAATIEQRFWEGNIGTVRHLNGLLKQTGSSDSKLTQDPVQHLKTCALAFVPHERTSPGPF